MRRSGPPARPRADGPVGQPRRPDQLQEPRLQLALGRRDPRRAAAQDTSEGGRARSSPPRQRVQPPPEASEGEALAQCGLQRLLQHVLADHGAEVHDGAGEGRGRDAVDRRNVHGGQITRPVNDVPPVTRLQRDGQLDGPSQDAVQAPKSSCRAVRSGRLRTGRQAGGVELLHPCRLEGPDAVDARLDTFPGPPCRAALQRAPAHADLSCLCDGEQPVLPERDRLEGAGRAISGG